MAKTTFQNGDPGQGIQGTIVSADFLNAINNHLHTGLDQDGHGSLPYGADNGAANAYVVNLNVNLIPPLTQYVSGMLLFFKALNTNTGSSTINVNSLGTKTIRKNISQNLAAGDIQAGQIVMLIYDGTNFQYIGGLDVHTVDGFHASATATANTIPVLNGSAKLPGSITGDADTVDTYHASTTPGQNVIPVGGTGGKLANDVDKVDGYHASATATANTIPVLNGSAKFPGSITGDADTVDTYHASTTPGQNVIPVGGTGGKLANDVDKVDGYHASATATADTIPVLNGSAKFPGSITGDADTVDSFHASTTPGQNVIPVGGVGGKLANDVDMIDGYHASTTPGQNVIPVGGTGGKLANDVDKVDGYHASTTPGQNVIPVGGTGGKLANDVDKVDGYHASQTPGANEIPVLNNGTLFLPQDLGAAVYLGRQSAGVPYGRLTVSGGSDTGLRLEYRSGGAPNTGLTIESNGVLKAGTTNTIWHAGNHGSGSGLDADMVDGKNPGSASGLATLDANTRLMQAANLLWDGTAARSASASSNSNVIPVTDANGDIHLDFIPNILTGKTLPARGATVYYSDNQIVTSGTELRLTWDTELLNTDNIHQAGQPARLYVPVGVTRVQVGFSVYFSGVNTTGYRSFRVSHPVLAYPEFTPPGAILPAISIPGNSFGNILSATSGIIPVDPSGHGWFDLYAYQNSGANMTIWGSMTNQTCFWLKVIE